jgi:hypothetical protein
VPDVARWLVVAGVLLVIVGALLWALPSVPWLGRLPGDIRIEREGFRLYFPIATCLLLSAVATLLFALISRLR